MKFFLATKCLKNQQRGEKMKILKWFVLLIVYALLILAIKNIQIILPILFEYKQIIEVIISYLLAIIIVILQCFVKCDDTTNNND